MTSEFYFRKTKRNKFLQVVQAPTNTVATIR